MINIGNNGQVRPVDLLHTPSSPGTISNAPSHDTDKPSVSGALFGAIQHMVHQGMPIDLERVIAVRNAIAEGQYPVDPMKIAEKIIDFDSNSGGQNI